jgi:hypothetical protein
MINSLTVRLIAASIALTAPAWGEDAPKQTKPMYLGTEPVESCIKRWDPGTHMTKLEWEDACRRISEERGTYLREQGSVPSDVPDAK